MSGLPATRLLLLGLAVPALSGVWIAWQLARTSPHGATAVVIAQGRAIYEAHCAVCHGAQLEGQPDWQVPLPSGRLPAPPHDASGHTWHHSDEVMLRIVREGTAAFVGGGYESDMPGFGYVLSDAEIRTVLDYIKSTWPQRERTYQENVSQPR